MVALRFCLVARKKIQQDKQSYRPELGSSRVTNKSSLSNKQQNRMPSPLSTPDTNHRKIFPLFSLTNRPS